MPSKSNLGEANRGQKCLIYVRHDKYAIICYPQSTDPLPCGTPPDSGGEFLVCSRTMFRCLTCAQHDKAAVFQTEEQKFILSFRTRSGEISQAHMRYFTFVQYDTKVPWCAVLTSKSNSKNQPALSKSQLNRIALLEIVRALCEC